MSFVTYAGMGAALLVASFVLIFSSIPVDQPPPSRIIPIATLETIGSTTPFHIQLDSLIPNSDEVPEIVPALATSTAQTPAPPLPPAPPPISLPAPRIPAPQTPVVVPAPLLPPAPLAATPTPIEKPMTPEPQTAAERAAARLQSASVNILCTGNGGQIRGMSASGVIIDPRGVILTVAHAAQYYVLADYPSPGSITCTVRTGSPARRAYTATPLFISESWVRENADVLVAQNPRGTGEHDFALLLITGSLSGSPIPSSFPYVPLASVDPQKGETAIIGSYAAQSLTSEQIRTALGSTLVTTTVKDRFTFGTNSIDLISLGGSIAAQTGSSGGGVASTEEKIIGMITTSTNQGAYETRNINAITPAHIKQSFKSDMGMSLDAFLGSDSLSGRSVEFQSRTAKLLSLLVSALEGA